MINLLSESAYIAQTNKIKTAITNKVNAIKVSLARIGTKLGAEINWLDDIESTLDDELTAINSELTDKGSTQADDFSEVAEKISNIQTGITPTGQIAITQNGTYDVTGYASASVKTPVESGLSTLVQGKQADLYSDSITMLNGANSFNVRTFITGVNLPNCTTINGSALGYMPIRYAILPKLRETANNMFYSIPKVLEYVILNSCSYISQNFGNSNPNFNILMIGYDGVCAVHGSNFLNSTPFRNGDGGTVYVPRKWVTEYQNATNWSALESTTFAAIEDNIELLESLGANVDEWKGAEE